MYNLGDEGEIVMKKDSILFNILGTLFLLVPLFLNLFDVLRLLSCILGITILIISHTMNKKNKIFEGIFILITGTVLIYGLDFISVRLFKTYPIIATEEKSSSLMKTYNGLFYRVYDCNSVLTLDKGYKKPFVCNKDLLKENDINTFLSNPKDSYNANLNKFVRITGKITKIVGDSEITLSSYTNAESLNGYVDFDNNKEIILTGLSINPKDYYIYDTIEVVGKVTSFAKKDEVNKIYLDDVIIEESNLYKDYELLVNDISSKELVKMTDNIYYLGIGGIYYKYSEDNIYSMDYLIKDKRVLLEDLTKDLSSKNINNDKDKLYELESYNLVVCSNGDVIFASKKIKNIEEICNVGA